MSTSKSSIEWTDRTWNPTRGCLPISPGCKNCYAMKMAGRFCGAGKPYEGLVKIGNAGPVWTGAARFVPAALREPLSWRQPSRVFVDSMSDLFFDGFTDEEIAAVFGVMAATPQHTYQVLTKRPERARAWFEWADSGPDGAFNRCVFAASDLIPADPPRRHQEETICRMGGAWPLPNVWIGASVEDQQRAAERLPHLLRVPAAVRFVSYEPALGPVDFRPWLPWTPDGARRYVSTLQAPRRCYDWNYPGIMVAKGCGWEGAPTRGDACPRCNLPTRPVGIDWIIAGGESGPGARPFDVAWMRSAIKQCRAAGVPAFCKQLGANVRDRNDAGFDGQPGDAWDFGGTFPADVVEDNPNGYREEYQGAPVRIRLRDRKGGDMAEWPADLRVQEFPGARP